MKFVLKNIWKFRNISKKERGNNFIKYYVYFIVIVIMYGWYMGSIYWWMKFKVEKLKRFILYGNVVCDKSDILY